MSAELVAVDLDVSGLPALDLAEQPPAGDLEAQIRAAVERSVPLAVDTLAALCLHERDPKVRLGAARELLRLAMALGVLQLDLGALDRFVRELAGRGL